MGIVFPKSYKLSSQIVGLLQSRGLSVADTLKAEHYISNIGYYRLSGYLYPLLESPKEKQIFKSGVSFNNALDLYRFDKKLRLLLFNEIEKIEIAFRSALANIVAKESGNIFWMTDASMYSKVNTFNKTMALIDKEFNNSKEDFIEHFKQKYSDPYPPAWILVEILPLGVITRIYSNLADNNLRKKIAANFSLPMPVFTSWLTVITLTRNTCCHHSRVWNKQNTIIPMITQKMQRPWIMLPVSKLRAYFDICIIKYFVDIVSPDNDMKQHLLDLQVQYPMVDIHAMGFPTGWQSEPLWRV